MRRIDQLARLANEGDYQDDVQWSSTMFLAKIRPSHIQVIIGLIVELLLPL